MFYVLRTFVIPAMLGLGLLGGPALADTLAEIKARGEIVVGTKEDFPPYGFRNGRGEIAGSITLVYDHHRHHLQDLLTDLQHDHRTVIISTLHCHLDHDNCLEILAVRGQAAEIKKLADELLSARGVKHGKLTITTTGKNLPG